MEIRVLGPLEVTAHGLTVVLGRRRERGLLGILALQAGALVPFDRLCDLLWEGDPPESAVAQLRANASRIRAALAAGGHPDADGLIVARGRGFQLRLDPSNVDAHRFRRMVEAAEEQPAAQQAQLLEEALDLWRGPILADSLSDHVRDRLAPELDELRCVAAETKAQAELAIGRPQRALTTTRSMFELFPHRESLVRTHMRSLVQAGRRAEAIDEYQRFKTRLAEDLGIDPDPETTELYATVLRDEPPQIADIPAQLPPPPSGFTGRGAELSWLRNTIGQRGLVVVVAGTAGVGKTGLAAHLAHRLAPNYPDGQLYANLSGFGSAQPLAALDVLAQFLRSLGVANEKVPTGTDEAAAQFRSLAAQRRMLLLLDNAHSAEQVRPLLPSNASCLAVVTSRDSLSGLVALDGARRLVLQPLPMAAATELLGLVAGPQRVAAEPEPARELAQLCGLLPLALRIAGANLADEPGRTIAEQVTLMRANPLAALELSGDEERGVRVAFDQSYGALPEPARRLFRLVSLTPGHDFSPDTAVALADEAGTAERLRHLANAHLLSPAPAGRYAMHDLIRAYARQRLELDDGPGFTAVRDRVAQWYVDSAAAAAALLQPASLRAHAGPAGRFADNEAAQAWLDAERTNLVAAARQYAYEGPASASWQIADAIGSDLAKRSQLVDLEAVATAAQESGSEIGRAVAELNFGRAHWVMAAYADAQRRFEAAAQAAKEQWPHGVAEAHRGLGNVALETGQLLEAIDHYENALALVDVAAAPAFHGSLTNNLGLVEAHLGRLDNAAARFENVVRWARESGWHLTLGQALSNLGEVYRNIGRYADAIPLIQEAAQLHRQSGNIGSEVVCLTQLAQALQDGGSPEKAWEELQTAHEKATATGEPVLIGKVLHAQGWVACGLKRFAEAERIYEELTAVGHQEVELNVAIGHAMAAMGLGRYADADARVTAATARAAEVGHGQHLVEGMLLRAQIQRLGGPAVFGETSLELAQELAGRALTQAGKWGLRRHAADALTLLGHLTGDISMWHKALRIYEELKSPKAGELAALLADHSNGLATRRS